MAYQICSHHLNWKVTPRPVYPLLVEAFGPTILYSVQSWGTAMEAIMSPTAGVLPVKKLRHLSHGQMGTQ